MNRLTLGDLSRITGFSRKTVSRVVNGEKEVRLETRRQILEAIEKYNYKPNVLAQGLRKQKSHTIGLIVHHLTNPFIPQLIETIEREISDTPYSILLSVSDINERTQRECVRGIMDKMVDGIILTNVNPTNRADLETLDKYRIPFVLVLNRLDGFSGNYVGVDFLYGSELMMNYLYGLGRRTIAFISGTPDNVSSLERWRGYRTFLVEHGLDYDDSLIETGSFLYEGGFSAFTRLITRRPDIDAVFCINDYTALGAIDAATRMNRRVPEDVVIAGFDDMPIASHSNIKLTTIRIPILLMARTAVQILMDAMDNPEAETRQVILKPELVIR